jgi:hypothetical protein
MRARRMAPVIRLLAPGLDTSGELRSVRRPYHLQIEPRLY